MTETERELVLLVNEHTDLALHEKLLGTYW